MLIIYKFIKTIIVVLDNTKWSTSQWENTLLDNLNNADWGILKAIICDQH